MSRIIVKNLPPKLSEDRLKSHFAKRGGLITDCQLKYSKTGAFRQFAFVGFKSEEQAREAIQHFNNTFIDTKKIIVEHCTDLGSRPKSAKDRFKKNGPPKRKPGPDAFETDGFGDPKQPQKKMRLNPFGELEQDPEFQQFLTVQKNVTSVGGSEKLRAPNKYIWSDDLLPGNVPVVSREKQMKESKRKTRQKNKKTDNDDSQDESGSGDDESDQDERIDEPVDTKKRGKGPKSGPRPAPKMPEKVFEHTVKIKGLPVKIKKAKLKEFFKPLKLISLRLPRNVKGIAFVSFADQRDLATALMKHRGFLDGKRIEVTKYDTKSQKDKADRLKEMAEKEERWSKQTAPPVKNPSGDLDDVQDPNPDKQQQHESLAETGRLFIRNLSYECTQDDLEQLFLPFGQLSEVHLSIDPFTGRPKGFAFVEFVFPEHALVAHNELDGKPFQGRMLHVLPARNKIETPTDSHITTRIESEKSSFKKEKKAKEHEKAGMSHNWNALFLGANAVADAIASKVGVTKAQLLADKEATDSIGVRMALAETQIVNDTRQFLLDNGINLDAFGPPELNPKDRRQVVAPIRSKTVMLAKNLPAGTTADELREMFSKHGTVNRVVLPPQGITAIVEMGQPTEAKLAFRGLAYSNFKHAPLYLEWAPVDVIRARVPKDSTQKSADNEAKDLKSPSNEGDEEGDDSIGWVEDRTPSVPQPPPPAPITAEPDATLFVKNLNFSTQESGLQELFGKYGPIINLSIAKRKHNGKQLSMGFGFIQFARKSSADEALKLSQHCSLDGHTLELKRSTRQTTAGPIQPVGIKSTNRGDSDSVYDGDGDQPDESGDTGETGKSTKLVVRNIPFEASEREVRALFTNFGDLKACRLPRKLTGTGSHRGFAFVDFVTQSDAKRAFAALSSSTHLYGRRLVLEWASQQD